MKRPKWEDLTPEQQRERADERFKRDMAALELYAAKRRADRVAVIANPEQFGPYRKPTQQINH